ncbi:alpha/beta hydrolase family protein, partial [Bacteroides nordii]|uniref:alpha/beta hydrolase family protein n=1 Tax=Bacteroides nordii TaxID=291645 RepID=UPI0034E61116
CSTEKQVTSYTPPTLLYHASDDYTVPLENSKMNHQRLVREGIKSRIEVFPEGEHRCGFSENYQFEGELRE